jgi:hypothetical protein
MTIATAPPKQYTLPFFDPKGNAAEVEEAVVFAVAETERNKGGLFRQSQEKLAFIAKLNYPIWLIPKNNEDLIFGGLETIHYTVTYPPMVSATVFLKKLETLVLRQDFEVFLSEYVRDFSQSKALSQFVLHGLISNADLIEDFSVYFKDAIAGQASNIPLGFAQAEKILANLTELDSIQSAIHADAQRLPECIQQTNKITAQFVSDLDFAVSSTKEEYDAKIRAQQIQTKPQITKLKRVYTKKIREATKAFDKQLKSLQLKKKRNLKAQKTFETKIRLYTRNAVAQARKGHHKFEKRWKEKIKRSEKKLDAQKKLVEEIEAQTLSMGQAKISKLNALNAELNSEIATILRPQIELESARDEKLRGYKQEMASLVSEAQLVVVGLNKALTEEQTIDEAFQLKGLSPSAVSEPVLLLVPFYVTCYQAGSNKRYLTTAPSVMGNLAFSSKLKGALGISKIKEALAPRFESITGLINRVTIKTKEDAAFEGALWSLGEQSNLLKSPLFLENVAKGLAFLRRGGWISEREQQDLSNQLTI